MVRSLLLAFWLRDSLPSRGPEGAQSDCFLPPSRPFLDLIQSKPEALKDSNVICRLKGQVGLQLVQKLSSSSAPGLKLNRSRCDIGGFFSGTSYTRAQHCATETSLGTNLAQFGKASVRFGWVIAQVSGLGCGQMLARASILSQVAKLQAGPATEHIPRFTCERDWAILGVLPHHCRVHGVAQALCGPGVRDEA